MGYQEILENLNKNPRELSLEAVRLLLKIAENIEKDPKNLKIRTLNKSNNTIQKKILELSGGKMCLKYMGFQEDKSSFILPVNADLKGLKTVKDALLMWKESIEQSNDNSIDQRDGQKAGSSSKMERPPSMKKSAIHNSNEEVITPIVLPPLESLYSTPFFHNIEVIFHSCLRYGNKQIQERARKLMPLTTMEMSALKGLRAMQEHSKKNKLPEPNISIQEMLLLELLQWFKEDFFSWVDSPDCDNCGGKTHFSHMSTDKKHFIYTTRVELHCCENCNTFTPFARYEDLNILLETRKGRCGEWANVFTLFCYAMGWDARYVLDENDHVWTEVYSIAQKRWLHCDPCENICDKPLIYESGWKKKIKYIIAYSTEEVQDVSWRYSSNHQEVLKRRNPQEQEKLIGVLMELRKKRQNNFSETRRAYLTKRLVLELADFLSENKPEDGENIGRQSGDVSWRLARGEIEDLSSVGEKHIWQITTSDLVDNAVTLRYSAADDTYELLTKNRVLGTHKKWVTGCFHQKNVIRKEERDWKQVYLARKVNKDEGNISWKFDFQGDLKLETIEIQFNYATFENGTVITKICSGDLCELIPTGSKALKTNSFNGQASITIESTLSGGKGDVAWQHAQLFRQPLDSSDFPFIVKFIFK